MPPIVPPPRAADQVPTRQQAIWFLVRTRLFQLRRVLRETVRGRPPRFERDFLHGKEGSILAESRSLLAPGNNPVEFKLQAGKTQNLRVAAARLDGLLIPRDAEFSFWRQVRRPTRWRGFVCGRELREGCIVPSVGGGLCQLSNALYNAALLARCRVTERHAHSRQVPGSMAAAGRDATVFWNYVDLRFRPPVDCRLEVGLTRRELVVRLHAVAPEAAAEAVPVGSTLPPCATGVAPTEGKGLSAAAAPVESCETCEVADCFRHPGRTGVAASAGITAWLMDGWQPEYGEYLREHHRPEDWLFVPLDSLRWRLGGYRWDTAEFTRVRQAPLAVLRRSWQSRRLASQGAVRQQTLLRSDTAMAERYVRGLPPEATHLVISQNLLPGLWRAGALGGRTFDVLMTRLPVAVLQKTLDEAAARHPQSRTLPDFRADPRLAEEEAAALAEARRWITPHTAIAKLDESRTIRLAWQVPPSEQTGTPRGRDVLFPASTLGRKGAYELAAAAREIGGLRVQLGGPDLEGSSNVWQGVETLPVNEGWQDVGAVVLPAWVEHQPRRLLRAVALGLPVIASEACGLQGVPGVTVVSTGNIAALRQELERECNFQLPGSSDCQRV